ncbi:MAG TPA: arginase [Pseudogracilibacillus sp.]|nr:arginase [Pseudogracilibacillus sp.]
MNKNISIIGVPMDLGQLRRGVDMGPSAIRYAGITERLRKLKYNIEDLGDVSVTRTYEKKDVSHESLRNLKEVVQANKNLKSAVSTTISNGNFPLVLGGDHSIAIGTISGLVEHYSNLGLIWYDAHGDINTAETSPSGNIHGMPLAVSLGYGHEKLLSLFEQSHIKPENVVLIGIRDLDDGEKQLLKDLNVKVYTMHEIDRIGMPQVMQETIDYLQEKTDGVHLSFDMDGIDPKEAPGVGTPVIGGATYRETHLAMEMLADADMITSAEIVEVNPMLDDKSKTAEMAIAVAGSLFGEKLI